MGDHRETLNIGIKGCSQNKIAIIYIFKKKAGFKLIEWLNVARLLIIYIDDQCLLERKNFVH